MIFPPAALAFLRKYGVYMAIALVAVIILTVAYCSGKTAGKSGEVIKQQGRELKVQEQLKDAGDAASETRVDDAVRLEYERKELQDALQAETDPAKRRALRGCVILRQQGRDTSGIAACSGLEGRP